MRTTRERLARAAALVVLAAPVAWACGPFFGERLLFDRAAMLRTAPRARLDEEVKALRVPTPALAASWAAGPEGADEVYRRQSREVDAAELTAALGQRADAAEVSRRYAALRAELAGLTAAPANASGGRQPGTLRPPPGLPPEFADYIEGAIARAQGNAAGARQAWERLLQRPASERRFRSTWAAFMLGRLLHGSDARASAARYQQTRELTTQGFRDPLGLGAASLGYEAQLALGSNDFALAARLYLQACSLDDPAAPASLRFLSWRLLRADEAARATALRDPTVRRVLVAHLVSSSQTRDLAADSVEARLLALLLASTSGEREVPGADRLAWIAYQRNDQATAEAWLQRAPDDSPITAWLRSKQLARRGKLTEAAAELTRATAAFPLAAGEPGEVDLDSESETTPLSRRLRAELGVLQLGRGQYAESLDLLLRAGSWRDAAHVAERVLTVDELRAYVDRNWPAAATTPAAAAPSGSPPSAATPPVAAQAVPGAPQPGDEVTVPALTPAQRLRYLLARRLARQGQWTQARPYLPAELLPFLDLYVAAQAIARGPGSAPVRAASLWRMAQLERHKGIELLGTEIGPDWAVDGGQFDEDASGPPRLTGALVRGDERRRIQASAPAFPGRFHYRRIAAERALEAARLLPDGDEQIGAMLCEATGWLSREPKAASKVAAEARRRKASCPGRGSP